MTVVMVFTQIDKKVITKIATGDKKAEEKPLLKIWCKDKNDIIGYETKVENVTTMSGAGWKLVNTTDMDSPIYSEHRCKY